MNAFFFLPLTMLLVADEPKPEFLIGQFGTHSFQHDGRIGKFCISPDGKQIAVSGDQGLVTCFDSMTGRSLLQYQATIALGYSQDGKKFAGIGTGTSLKAHIVLFDSATGREIKRFRQGNYHIDFSSFAGNRYLITADYDESLYRIFDVERGEEVRTLPRTGRMHPKPEAVSPDGKYLATGETSDSIFRTFRVYDIETGKEQFSIYTGQAWQCAFSPDGKSVFTFSGKLCNQFDVSTGKKTGSWEVKDHEYYHCYAGTNRGPVQFRQLEGKLQAFEIAHGRVASKPFEEPFCTMGQPYPVSLVVSPFGTKLRVWDVKSNRAIHTPTGHSLAVTGISVRDDGLIVSSDHNSIHHWGFDGQERNQFKCVSNYGIYSSTLSPDARRYANGDAGGTIRIWDTALGRNLGSVKGTVNVECSLRFNRDGSRLSYPGWDRLRVWNTETFDTQWTENRKLHQFSASCFSPDGKLLYSSRADGELREWDTETGDDRRTFVGHQKFIEKDRPAFGGIRANPVPRPGHEAGVKWFCIAADGRRLVSVGNDATLRIWETASGKECAMLERISWEQRNLGSGGSYRETGFPMALSPDRRHLAIPAWVTDRKYVIDIWDIHFGNRVRTLDGHRNHVSALVFSPDGKQLLSGSQDGRIYQWDVSNLPIVKPVPSNERNPEPKWEELESPDPAIAYASIAKWLLKPQFAVEEFRRQLKTVTATQQSIDQLIRELDDSDFDKREHAAKHLRSLGDRVLERLSEVEQKSPSAEVRKRVIAIAAGISSDQTITARAVEILEIINTTSSQKLLEDWSKGDPKLARSRLADESLGRLRSGKPKSPVK